MFTGRASGPSAHLESVKTDFTTETASCVDESGSEMGHRKGGISEGGPTTSVPNSSFEQARPQPRRPTSRTSASGVSPELPKSSVRPLLPVNKLAELAALDSTCFPA